MPGGGMRQGADDRTVLQEARPQSQAAEAPVHPLRTTVPQEEGAPLARVHSAHGRRETLPVRPAQAEWASDRIVDAVFVSDSNWGNFVSALAT